MKRTDGQVYNSFTYNGIDRYDNSIGYVLSNCVSCCHQCNMAKKTLHGDDFIAMAIAIAANAQIKDQPLDV